MVLPSWAGPNKNRQTQLLRTTSMQRVTANKKLTWINEKLSLVARHYTTTRRTRDSRQLFYKKKHTPTTTRRRSFHSWLTVRVSSSRLPREQHSSGWCRCCPSREPEPRRRPGWSIRRGKNAKWKALHHLIFSNALCRLHGWMGGWKDRQRRVMGSLVCLVFLWGGKACTSGIYELYYGSHVLIQRHDNLYKVTFLKKIKLVIEKDFFIRVRIEK